MTKQSTNLKLLLIALATALPGVAATAPDLVRPATGETVDVIVQYANPPGVAHYRRLTARHSRVKATFDQMPLEQLAVTPEALADLENDPNVVSISPDRPVQAVLDHVAASVQLTPLADYFEDANRPMGAGIGVAVIDSGINVTHPNFNWFGSNNSRVVYSESLIGGDTLDHYGHGTHVAGILAGADNLNGLPPSFGGNSTATRFFWGMIPFANIINLRVLDSNGNGSDSTVIAGINRAIQLKSQWNIRVINLSLGRPVITSYKNDPLCQAVEAAWKAGIIIVVAAGNNGRDNSMGTSGYGTITAPGNDPYVITVGATNDKSDLDRNNDVIATYSSKGPTAIDHIAKPDLVAPGNRVVSYQAPGSTLVTNYPGNQIHYSDYQLKAPPPGYSPYFFTLSGTSMATPVVSAAAVYLLDRSPDLTPDQVKAKLMKTAWSHFPPKVTTHDPVTNMSYTAYHDAFTIGAGQIDLWAAYNNTDMPGSGLGHAASPVTYYDSSSHTVKLSMTSPLGTSLIWGDSSAFATSLIWGDNISGTSLIWGDSVTWDSTNAAGFSLIWGDNSPWTLSTPTGEALTIAIQGEP
jgi:serine protease AprX